MARNDQRGRRLGLAAASILVVACVGRGPTKEAVLQPSSVWGPFMTRPSVAADRTQYRGPLFALRSTDESLNGAVWIRCPLEVPYRFEPIAPSTFAVDIEDLDQLVRFLPVTYRELRPAVQSGQRVHVEYTIAGRFVVDAPPPRAASIVCPAATHHVRTIVVGAYRVTVGGSRGPSVASADERRDTHGRPSECLQSKLGTPREGCTVPLAFELGSIPGHDPGRRLRLDEVATANQLPRADNMPGTTQPGRSGLPTVGFDECHAGFEPTGNAEADLQDLTHRCGEPTSMVPHSEVLTGWQTATGDVARYTVHFDEGRCYRAFGVGGEGVRDLDMGWHDPSGRLIARDVRPDEWAMVAPNGPTCADASGDFVLVVSVERGEGAFAVQVWRVDEPGP